MSDNHPSATTTRADEAKSPDSKSADSGKSEAKSDASQLPPASITHHTIKVGGVPLDYTAEAGTLALPGSGGKTAANIFYVAYTRDPKNAKRPLTFVFNGAPALPPPISISAASARASSRSTPRASCRVRRPRSSTIRAPGST